MKTVKNIDELHRLALKKGATVSLGGSRFNTTGERGKPVAPRPAPAEPVDAEPPAPAAAQAEPAAPQPEAPSAPSIESLAAGNERIAEALREIVSTLKERAVENKVRWKRVDFKVDRDGDGLLTGFSATASA